MTAEEFVFVVLGAEVVVALAVRAAADERTGACDGNTTCAAVEGARKARGEGSRRAGAAGADGEAACDAAGESGATASDGALAGASTGVLTGALTGALQGGGDVPRHLGGEFFEDGRGISAEFDGLISLISWYLGRLGVTYIVIKLREYIVVAHI